MRNRELHDALRNFALEAAATLTAAQQAGHELKFDLAEERGRGPVLYQYLPLTDEYIAVHWPALRSCQSFASATAALGSGAAPYLRLRGSTEVDAEPALRAMLERLYEDATELDFPEERFERVYDEVEGTLYAEVSTVTVVAPLSGVELEPERVDLGDGLSLVAGDASEAPGDAVWPDPHERSTDRALPNPLLLLECELVRELPLEEARGRFGDMVRRMRLFKPGRIGLGPVGFARAGGGMWHRFEVGEGAPGHGGAWRLETSEAPELRHFIDLSAQMRPGGAVGWALDRLDMGCSRAHPAQAVSDYLLALRGLLDPEGEGGGDRVALRLAMLCAERGERRALEHRVELARTLERLVMSGRVDRVDLDELGVESPEQLVAEMEGYLRALLRDVTCGYLDQDLRRVADDLLLENDAPIEVEARDLREQVVEDEFEEWEAETGELMAEELEGHEEAGEPHVERSGRRLRTAVRSQLATSVPAGAPPEPPTDAPDHVEDEQDLEPDGPIDDHEPDEPVEDYEPVHDQEPDEPVEHHEPYVPGPDDSVTGSVDWGFDEDASDWSAPV